MSRIPDLRELPDLPPEISQSALEGGLVLFVGSGVSMLVNLPSLSGLAWKALEDLRQKGYTNYSELEQLKNLDPKKQLSIAKIIASENGADLDLRKYLAHDASDIGIYKYLNRIGCVCVTTNYDELLSPRFQIKTDPSTTAYTITRITEKEEFHDIVINTHLDLFNVDLIMRAGFIRSEKSPVKTLIFDAVSLIPREGFVTELGAPGLKFTNLHLSGDANIDGDVNMASKVVPV